MNHVLKRVSKIDDATVYSVYDELRAVLAEYSVTVTFSFFPGVNVTEDQYPRADAIGRQSINLATLSVNRQSGSLNIYFTRYLTDVSNNQVASAVYDQFAMNFGDDRSLWNQDQEKILRLLSVIDRYCIVETTAKDESETSAVLGSLITGFGRTHEKLLASLDQKILEAEQRRIDLDQEFAAKESARLLEVQAALKDLEGERRKLERQSHMAERRRLLRDLAQQTSQEASKSKLPIGALITRWVVFFASIAVATAAGYFSYLSFEAFHNSATTLVEWVLLGRAVLASIVCLGSLVYAVTWLKGFYEADLENSRALDRFHYDLMRSSWIIETVLEVHHEAKGEVPVAWLEGVTRGLFDSASSRKTNDSASQALAALLGFSASASFGPDGPKFDLGKNAKKLSKAANEASGDE